jgi:shikimate dehydrogenase
MKIDRETALYGVLGHPLGHTLSPELHNPAFRFTERNAVYLAFDTEDLEGAVRGVTALGVRGVSVTHPFKSSVIPFLDRVDPLAEKIGAVNTLINEGGQLTGFNTDAFGALHALGEEVELSSGRKVLLVGAGGAARAIGFALMEKGVDLILSNRTVERGRALACSLGCSFVSLEEAVKIRGVDLLIHTTPVGMFPEEDRCLLPAPVLREGMTVMDVVYNPVRTKLLSLAEERGCRTVSGLHMFIHQGAEQFRIWTGSEPPVEVMADAVRRALPGGEGNIEGVLPPKGLFEGFRGGE